MLFFFFFLHINYALLRLNFFLPKMCPPETHQGPWDPLRSEETRHPSAPERIKEPLKWSQRDACIDLNTPQVEGKPTQPPKPRKRQFRPPLHLEAAFQVVGLQGEAEITHILWWTASAPALTILFLLPGDSPRLFLIAESLPTWVWFVASVSC